MILVATHMILTNIENYLFLNDFFLILKIEKNYQYYFLLGDLTIDNNLDDFLNYISILVSENSLTPRQIDNFRNIFRDCL